MFNVQDNSLINARSVGTGIVREPSKIGPLPAIVITQILFLLSQSELAADREILETLLSNLLQVERENKLKQVLTLLSL